MPRALTTAANLLHKIILGRVVLYTISILCTSIMTALAGTNWETANNQTRFMITVGIVGSWTLAMVAYLDKSAARVAAGELPFVEIPEGTPSKTESTTTVTNKTTVTTPPPEPPAS